MSDADNAVLHGVAIKTIRRWRRDYQRRNKPRGHRAHHRPDALREAWLAPTHQARSGGGRRHRSWKHWPCLFPQHGPGRKHERPIVLEDWQRSLVEAHPGALLRGLFHSDGCRVKNWTQRLVAGEMKRYEYPRRQFTNHSTDIRELCCSALDQADVPWRQSKRFTISVSRRAAVARLGELIGPKA
ncbi:transcriptional regulator [Nocardioides sp. GXQ0305]|uniref:transcriptional regulator n=1 Tax=Nocardioides sp. GXQ0305 TaxID=3423912 RepID=UPI003D7C8B04